MNRTLRWALAAASLALALGRAVAADVPHPLMSLYQRLPTLPSTAAQAAQWVDRRGQVVNPALLALSADIETHRQAVARISAARAGEHRAQAVRGVEDLGRGMADIGIDMARMSSDAAYAEQVQARLRALSPQEMVAVAQRMSAPMQQDKRLHNESQAIVDDPAPVRAAAEAGFTYAGAQVERIQAHRAAWAESEAAVARITARPLTVAAPKPKMEFDNPGCEAACRGHWEAHAAQMLPLMIARDTEILGVRSATLARMQAAMAQDLKTADRLLVAARYGEPARSQLHQARIASYDHAALAEILQLLDRMTETLKSAAALTHCGKQAVQVPLAVCN